MNAQTSMMRPVEKASLREANRARTWVRFTFLVCAAAASVGAGQGVHRRGGLRLLLWKLETCQMWWVWVGLRTV